MKVLEWFKCFWKFVVFYQFLTKPEKDEYIEEEFLKKKNIKIYSIV